MKTPIGPLELAAQTKTLHYVQRLMYLQAKLPTILSLLESRPGMLSKSELRRIMGNAPSDTRNRGATGRALRKINSPRTSHPLIHILQTYEQMNEGEVPEIDCYLHSYESYLRFFGKQPDSINPQFDITFELAYVVITAYLEGKIELHRCHCCNASIIKTTIKTGQSGKTHKCQSCIAIRKAARTSKERIAA